MYMKGENLDSLTNMMRSVIDSTSPIKMRITNTQYMDLYFKIFFDEMDNNDGEPIHYDVFGDRLWIKLNQDVNQFPEIANEFMDTWNAWVYLYRYLKMNNKLK